MPEVTLDQLVAAHRDPEGVRLEKIDLNRATPMLLLPEDLDALVFSKRLAIALPSGEVVRDSTVLTGRVRRLRPDRDEWNVTWARFIAEPPVPDYVRQMSD